MRENESNNEEKNLPWKERKMKWKIEEIEKEENRKRKGRKKSMG